MPVIIIIISKYTFRCRNMFDTKIKFYMIIVGKKKQKSPVIFMKL